MIAKDSKGYTPSALVFHPTQRAPLPAVNCPLLAIGWGMHALLGNHLGPLCPQEMLLEHQESGLFAGLKSPMHVGSDLLPFPTEISAEYQCIGKSREGAALAVEHRHEKRLGLLFRPESLLTEKGLTLLVNFFAREL
ncbi:MAG: hypothetical protein JSR80_07145 [Verrucomicrobia bacterium]|nr:hypothetical protein [Verrucomicrobiota bacterium]